MDQTAEDAIRSAFKLSTPHNAVTIPERAQKILADPLNGPERIHTAVEAMVARGALVAPAEPYKDWRLA